jgi:molecular chaperone GrpE
MAANSTDKHHDHHRSEPHAAQRADQTGPEAAGEDHRDANRHTHSSEKKGGAFRSASEDSRSDDTDLNAFETASDEKIARLEATITDLEDRFKRALADQENSRKRTERDAERAVKFATFNLASDLLSTIDNLQYALNAMPDADESNESMTRLLQGVRATERALLAAMKKHGVRRIDPLGEPFDPNLHEVVGQVDGTDLPGGTVTEVLQPGYLHHDRLLRPAIVNVAKSTS